MRILFFLLMFTIILGGNFYVFYRLVNMAPQISILRWAIIAIGVLLVSSLILFFVLRESVPLQIASFIYTVGTSWFFIAVYFILIFLVLDILRLTHLVPVGTFMYKSWIGLGSVVGFVTILMTYGYINYLNKERVELNITLNKGEAEPQSALKLVAITDLHLGFTIGADELAKWVELINKEQPDVVLVGGDLIDNSISPLHKMHLDEVLQSIQSKYGIYMCVGNHEYISDLRGSLNFLRQAGIHVLRDSTALIHDSFYIVGRDDRMNPHRKPLAELTDSLDKRKPLIVLDHQPYELSKVDSAGVDLQISGHTHHGQIWPISWITEAMYEKAHGYLRKGNSHIYVSSGIGIWGGKFRVGTQSEYVVINLKY